MNSIYRIYAACFHVLQEWPSRILMILGWSIKVFDSKLGGSRACPVYDGLHLCVYQAIYVKLFCGRPLFCTRNVPWFIGLH